MAALIMYKFVLRVFFGMIIVPDDRIGLVVKKFALYGNDQRLPDGRIIATRGEAGMQAKPLAPWASTGECGRGSRVLLWNLLPLSSKTNWDW